MYSSRAGLFWFLFGFSTAILIVALLLLQTQAGERRVPDLVIFALVCTLLTGTLLAGWLRTPVIRRSGADWRPGFTPTIVVGAELVVGVAVLVGLIAR